MLIKISQYTYINSQAVEAIQKIVNGEVIIYTRGGGKFYYDGTLEECIERLKEVENGEQGSNQGKQ